MVQHACTADREANVARGIEGARQACAQGAQLVAFPELHTLPWFPQVADYESFELAEPVPGPTTARFSALARELNAVLVLSLFEIRRPGLGHSTAVVIEADGSIAGLYRKSHIPQAPGAREKVFFAPGDTGLRPIPTSLGPIGILLSWDAWFPEAARLMALGGARMLICPASAGAPPAWTPDQREREREAWITLQRGHAVANGLPVAAINRCGFEPASTPPGSPSQREGIHFWGSSFLTGPQGELVALASDDQPQVVMGEIDTDRTDRVQREWHFFRDRRIDCYGDLTRVFRDPDPKSLIPPAPDK